MKKVLKTALAVICAALCLQSAQASESTTATAASAKANTLQVDDVPDPGFIGTPMLKKYGYAANAGAFRLEIGQGVSNPGFMTDDDPTNYATGAGIGATVALDQIVVVSQDPDSEIIIPKYKSGDVVGFVLSDDSNAGSVLNLDVIKMFAIYLYNGKELVATINAKGTELDILGLSLISYGAGMQTVKLPVPKDSDGNDIVFDGVGLGVAGVDASVIEQLRIHYAFVDSSIEVPIIKRYFHDASAKTQGMVTGAKNLVNNNTKDGATTAVLNIGGAYYDVYANEPIPTGVEAGFAITSGTALKVDLGSAVRMQVIVKDADGNYKNINVTTGFDVVGLQLAGGGNRQVTTMIPTELKDDEGNVYYEFYGLRLERIYGVDIDLGATVVHYAYVKLPKYPDEKVPYLASMYILPGASYEKAGIYNEDKVNYHAQETFQNKLLIRNSTTKPLLTQELMPKAYRKGALGSPSYYYNGAWHRFDYAMMSLFRSNVKDNGKEDKAEYVGAICIWHDTYGSHDTWYYTFQKDGEPEADANHAKVEIPGPDENGVIDFGSIELDLAKVDDFYQIDGNTSENISAFNYWLYVHESDIAGEGYKTMDEGYELDYTEVVVPKIQPSYEIAGVHSLEELTNSDREDENYSTAPHPGVKTNAYQNYIEVVVPDLVDYKTVIDKVTVYRHKSEYLTHEAEEIYEEAELTGTYEWTANGGNTNFHYIHDDGACKLVFGTEDYVTASRDDAHNYFTAVVSVKLSDAYAKELDEAFPTRSEFPVDAAYGWVPSKAEEHALPQLTHNSTESHTLIWGGDRGTEYLLKTSLSTSLNDATVGHAAAGDILYTQWATVKSNASRARAMAPAADGVAAQHTTFNVYDGNEPETEYTSTDKSAHSATLYAAHSVDGSVNYNVTTRAYVPVLPSGFTAEQMTPSYIVTDANDAGTIDDPIVTGVENVEISDEDAEAEYFNLQGVRVANPQAGHVYIMRRGTTATKVLVK